MCTGRHTAAPYFFEVKLMKLLTLNTHSLQGKDYPEKLALFVKAVCDLRPDLIAMQEVNQTMTAAPASRSMLKSYVPVPGHQIPVLEDNHALRAAAYFQSAGLSCSWTWLPVKRGYRKYDEGLALFSFRHPIVETSAILLSPRDDYEDWKTRKALGVRLEGMPGWFYSVHTGWWKDGFPEQWSALERVVAGKRKDGPIWLLGDFNAPAHIQGESYDLVRNSCWLDTCLLAEEADGGVTVQGPIDGWPDQREGLRIDYIWCSEKLPVTRSQVMFNGTNGPVVSDHFGVLLEVKEEL